MIILVIGFFCLVVSPEADGAVSNNPRSLVEFQGTCRAGFDSKSYRQERDFCNENSIKRMIRVQHESDKKILEEK